MEDEDGFDFHWDIKLPNGMNVTENKLFEAMKKLGLNPEPQYQISQMKVDFAFPEEMIAIEVNGDHHYTEEQKLKDKKRYFVLRNNGWKVKTFSAKRVYYHSNEVAEEILRLLSKNESEEETFTTTYSERTEEEYQRLYKAERKKHEIINKQQDRKREKARKKMIIAICIFIVAILLIFIFRYYKFDKSAVNLTTINQIINTPEIDSLCLKVCGNSKIFEKNGYTATSNIKCYCEKGVFYLDLRTKTPISEKEVEARNEYYNKNSIIPYLS